MNSQTLTYEIASTDFDTLSDGKKFEAVSKFLGFLRTLQRRTRITLVNEPLSIRIGGDSQSLVQTHTYVHSPVSLDAGLSGFSHHLVAARDPFPVKKEVHSVLSGSAYLEMQDGTVGKCLTLYGLPSRLYPAWVYSLLGRAQMVSLRIAPLRHDVALTRMHRYVGMLAATQLKAPSHAYQYEKGRATMEALARQETRLFSCECVAFIQAPTHAQLKSAEKDFHAHAASTMTRWEAVPARQAQMLSLGWGKQLHMELGSLSIFYPFASSDLIDSPGGIYLGVNMTTGAPVIWDHATLDSYNILILARVGKGKSVTAKTILTRLLDSYPDSMVFIIDPKGEYPADKWGLQEADVSGSSPLGLDPFGLFSSKSDAADIIADICDVGEDDAPIRNEILAAAEESDSVEQMYSRLDPSGRAVQYVQRLMAEDLRQLISGHREFGGKTVVSLKGKSQTMASTLTVLSFAKAWKTIQGMSSSQPKIVIVDEGWRLFKKKNTSRIVEEIARLGRAYHAIGIFITQEPRDIAANDYGRIFSNNAGLKIILGLEPDGARAAQEVLQLTERETEIIPSFSRGRALLLTKGYRIRAQIQPSRAELALFDTDPTRGAR